MIQVNDDKQLIIAREQYIVSVQNKLFTLRLLRQRPMPPRPPHSLRFLHCTRIAHSRKYCQLHNAHNRMTLPILIICWKLMQCITSRATSVVKKIIYFRNFQCNYYSVLRAECISVEDELARTESIEFSWIHVLHYRCANAEFTRTNVTLRELSWLYSIRNWFIVLILIGYADNYWVRRIFDITKDRILLPILVAATSRKVITFTTSLLAGSNLNVTTSRET